MILTNCARCHAVCASTCDLCADCRECLENNVRESLARAGWPIPDVVEIQRIGGSDRPARVVRQIDSILARHNRQEARARRRRPVSWDRLVGFVLIGLGALGLTWGFLQVCVWIGQGITAWMGGTR